jgi:hypothetical protein
MTMHLEGPYLTTTRYAKQPHRKWASSEAKRRAEAEASAWTELEQRLAESAPRFSGRPVADPDMPRGAFRPLVLGPAYPPGREPLDIPSRPDTPGTVGTRPADKVYTGTAIKGIGTLHKSNAVPVFTDEEAVDIAHMRR